MSQELFPLHSSLHGIAPPLAADPFVSVILAIRNEASFIERTLTAILEQDFPHERMEVLIADGQSTDATRAVIQAIAGRCATSAITILDNPGWFVSPGLNAALRAARGDIIVRIDGHTIIERDYVRSCVEALLRTGADNVGGRMDPVGQNPFGKAVALATSSPFGVGGARFHYSQQEEWVDTVYLGAWPRAVFDRLGGFDEEQIRNQDDEFNYRLREHGGKVLLTPRIRSQYFNRGTVASLWKQYYQYGFWKVRVMQKHPKQMQARQFVPALFVSGWAALAMASIFAAPARYLLAGAAIVYLSANAVAAVSVARKKAPELTPLVMLSFGVLHFAYGAGFLAGLMRFGGRGKKRGPGAQSIAVYPSGTSTNAPN
ncbi:MAG TPA: glycosyltransferase family 2 protein [Bryobacteraceae bacterium]